MGLIDTDTGLGFGTGLVWLTGGIGQSGLTITSSTSAAATLLALYGPYGIAMVFDTDQSIAIANSTASLNFASQGNVSAAGALIGPSAKITYTAPSPKLCMQTTGLFAYQAHNLYLNSAAPANQSITVLSGQTYNISVTGTVSIALSGAASGTVTAGSPIAFTAATTTLTCGSTAGSGTVHLRRTPSNTDYVETTSAAVYALPYEWDTSGNPLGIRIEEARTNLITNSSNLSGSTWTRTNISITAPGGTDLFGNAVQKVTEASGSSVKFLFQTSGGGSTTQTFSVIGKSDGSSRWLVLRLYVAANRWLSVVFNPADGSITQTSSGAVGPNPIVTSSGSVSLGNGWYRMFVSVTSASSTSVPTLFLTDTATPTFDTSGQPAAYTGDGSSGILVSHVQIEAGGFRTSPIITTGGTITRAVDNDTVANALFPWDAAVGSAYAYVNLFDTSAERSMLGEDANSKLIYTPTTDPSVFDGTNTVASGVTIAAGTAFKAASSWTGTTLRMAANGTAAAGTFDGTMGAASTLSIGQRSSGSTTLNGHMRACFVVNNAQGASGLQTVTT